MSDPAPSIAETSTSETGAASTTKNTRKCEELPSSTDIEEFKKQITSSDCLLILMGTLGAGRTTFIYELMDTDMPVVVRSPELQLAPDTREISYRYIEPTTFTKGHRVLVLDTPGVTGSQNSDWQLLKELREWIGVAVKKKVAFVGIIFLQSLMDQFIEFRFEDLPACFAPCVDKKIPHQLILASTQWSKYMLRCIERIPTYSWDRPKTSKKKQKLEDKAEAEAEVEKTHTFLETSIWPMLIAGGAKAAKLPEIGTGEKQLVMDMIPELKASGTGWFSKVFPSRLSISKRPRIEKAAKPCRASASSQSRPTEEALRPGSTTDS